jgi:hypothetical protein
MIKQGPPPQQQSQAPHPSKNFETPIANITPHTIRDRKSQLVRNTVITTTIVTVIATVIATLITTVIIITIITTITITIIVIVIITWTMKHLHKIPPIQANVVLYHKKANGKET